jgi:hypothetical protein
MVVTFDTSQLPIGWLNDAASLNMDSMVVTLLASQALIPSLKFGFLLNSLLMLVTWDTSYLLMCPYSSSAAAGSEHQRLTVPWMSPFHLDSLLSRNERNILSMKAAVKHIREFLLCNLYKHSRKARDVTFIGLKGFTAHCYSSCAWPESPPAAFSPTSRFLSFILLTLDTRQTRLDGDISFTELLALTRAYLCPLLFNKEPSNTTMLHNINM